MQPGPQLFVSSGPLVWALIASLYLGNVMLLVLNLPLVGLWVRLLSLPAPLLYGGIMVFSSLGVYGLNKSVIDLVLLFVFGLIGFLMRRYRFPRRARHHRADSRPARRKQFRRALMISQGDASVFLTHPISAFFLIAAVAIFLIPMIASVSALRGRWARRRCRILGSDGARNWN